MKRSLILGWAATLFLAIALLGIPMIPSAQAHPSTFPDVQETDAAHDAIESLAGGGIAGGFADRTFRPDESLTRAQAAKMLVAWQGLALPASTATGRSPFPDVDTAQAGYVAAATAAGWVHGFTDGTFRPHAHMTREQMAVVVVRSLELEAATRSLTTDQIDGVLERFADEEAISPHARPHVALAVMKGLFTGDGDRLDPLAAMTRAQFSLVLYRADVLGYEPLSNGSAANVQSGEETEQAGQTAYIPDERDLAAFMDTHLFRPHDSPIAGEMVLQNAEWYGIPPLPQLVILAAETSLGDPVLGGVLARRNNFGCLRYHGAGTPWGLLSDGKVWLAGKDWYSFATPELGMAAFGRYLKAGVDGFYVSVLSAKTPDWDRFAAVYYGRGASGFSSYVNRLRALEDSFRAEAAEQEVSF
jgi:hypothetical protein